MLTYALNRYLVEKFYDFERAFASVTAHEYLQNLASLWISIASNYFMYLLHTYILHSSSVFATYLFICVSRCRRRWWYKRSHLYLQLLNINWILIYYVLTTTEKTFIPIRKKNKHLNKKSCYLIRVWCCIAGLRFSVAFLKKCIRYGSEVDLIRWYLKMKT